ncbi:MAG: hypothetical protein WBB82_01080 [Limnothrix sp.]
MVAVQCGSPTTTPRLCLGNIVETIGAIAAIFLFKTPAACPSRTKLE